MKHTVRETKKQLGDVIQMMGNATPAASPESVKSAIDGLAESGKMTADQAAELYHAWTTRVSQSGEKLEATMGAATEQALKSIESFMKKWVNDVSTRVTAMDERLTAIESSKNKRN